jgi:hypothetical protein
MPEANHHCLWGSFAGYVGSRSIRPRQLNDGLIKIWRHCKLPQLQLQEEALAGEGPQVPCAVACVASSE